MLRCYIEGRNIVSNTETMYDITEGAVFTENYNETLDSGTIIIQQLTSKIEIEPYDVVVIESYGYGLSINTRRMCVDTVTCTQVSLVPAIFKYEISLFSETKLLEGILCPNLAITKLASGTPRTVKEYIVRYVVMYGPKLNSSETQGAYGDKFTLSAELNRFDNIECPEMQWNQPTLREVLTDLMMVDDCIPVVRNNVIGCIDISLEKGEITDAQKAWINYITESHSSEDYVSSLKMNLVNAANNSMPTGAYSDIEDADIPSDTTRIVEKIGFRNDESYLLTTENMRLQTSFPIWKIFYCEALYTMDVHYTYEIRNQQVVKHISAKSKTILKDSSVNYILEHAEWLTKDVLYGGWQPSMSLNSNYRNTCLYYTRGGRNIENFNAKYQQQFLWIDNTQYVYDMIAHNSANDQVAYDAAYADFQENVAPYGGTWVGAVGYTGGSYKDAEFNLSYEPISECIFSASKGPLPRNKREVTDNQTNSYIDVNRQGLLEYMKANRLGNKMALINGRYQVDETDIPDLGYSVNGKIIFRKQISVYDRHIDVNLQATENYVLRDYFTGVKSKLRSWRLASGGDVLTRGELIKYFINSNLTSISNNVKTIPVYDFLDEYLEKFKYCVLRFSVPSGSYLPNNKDYAGTTYQTNRLVVEFTKHKIGNSVVFTIKMPDNRYAGNYVSNYNGTDGRVEQKGIAYADQNGEVSGVFISFYKDFNPDGFSNTTANRALKPLVNDSLHFSASDLVYYNYFEVNKDNKEILQISIQFEVNPYANDIFIGKK